MEQASQEGISWTSVFRLALSEFFVPVILILFFIAAGCLIEWTWPQPGLMKPLRYVPSFAFFSFVGLLQVVLVLTWHRWRQKFERRWCPGLGGWRLAWTEATQRALTPSRLANLAIMSLFVALLLNTFGSWKLAIPQWAGFRWEAQLIDLSRAVHGGVTGWHFLQPALGRPAFTVVLDRVYYTWLPVFVGMVFWLGVWRGGSLARRRFVLALTLVWLGLGVVVATAGASAGPIFLDRVMPGSDAFHEMFDYLTRVHQWVGLMTFEGRELLWAAHVGHWGDPFIGISAFPSIHVSMASLYVVALWGSGWARVLPASVYAVAIIVSSVHLGWHYAVDAYAGVVGAIVCWGVAGLWVGSVRSPEPKDLTSVDTRRRRSHS
jgi:hypothetical protein